MKLSPLPALLATLVLPAPNSDGQELRGTWLARDSLGSKDSLAQAMDTLASNNFNVVYVNAWSRGYPLWPSQVFSNHTGTAIDPAFTGRDIMAEAIAEGHRNGLHVVAWMEYGFVGGYTGWYPGASGKGRIFDTHPDWVAKTQSGTEVDGSGFYWMASTRPEVQQFLIDLAVELAIQYDLDGVELDRIRYSSLEYGYDDYTQALYAAEHGGQNPPAQTSNAGWIRWRADKLNAFHKLVYDTIKSYYPQFMVADAPSHYSSSSYSAYNSFCQDWLWWVNSNAVDTVQLQTYVATSTSFQNNLNWVLDRVADPARVHPSFALRPNGTWLGYGDLLNFVDVARNGGFSGQAVWYYQDLTVSNYLGNFSTQRYTTPSAPPYLPADWRDHRDLTAITDATKAVRSGTWFEGTGGLSAGDPFLSGDDRAAGEYTPGMDVRAQGAAALGWLGTSGIDGYGVGHAGTTANFQPNATGENSPAVTYEQGGRLRWLGVGDFPADRHVTRQLKTTPNSAEWWVGIMVNRNSWAGSPANTYVVGGFTGPSGSGLQVGYDDQIANDSTPDLVVRLGGINRIIETNVPPLSGRYVLLQLQINPAGNDTVSVWNNPASVDPPGPADFIWNDVNVSDSLTPFTQSKYQSPGQSGEAFFDELRLATNLTGIVTVQVAGGGDSIHAASGAPARVDYYFDVPVAGVYEVYAFQTMGDKLTSNAHYAIFGSHGDPKTNWVDQTDSRNSRWVKVGTTLLEAGRQHVFQVSNEGVPAGRFVGADAGLIVLNRRLSRTPEVALRSDANPLEAGRFQFRLGGNAGQVIGLEGSTNLLDWVTAGTVTLTNAEAVFLDPTQPPEPVRYYRARLVSP